VQGPNKPISHCTSLFFLNYYHFMELIAKMYTKGIMLEWGWTREFSSYASDDHPEIWSSRTLTSSQHPLSMHFAFEINKVGNFTKNSAVVFELLYYIEFLWLKLREN